MPPLIVLVVLLATGTNCLCQTYPRWFLDPVNVNCGPAAAGYVVPSFHKTSSDSEAYLKACENLTRHHEVELSGSESYWQTEAGVYWMDNTFTEKIDSAYYLDIVSRAKKLANRSSKNMTIVLASENDCSLPDSLQAVIQCPKKQPAWVETVPQSDKYIYAVGVAPEYFYETSSWESAEKKARFNLARDFKVTLKAMQKDESRSGQEIRTEDISVTISHSEVVYRWKNSKQGLYYVLMRAPVAEQSK